MKNRINPKSATTPITAPIAMPACAPKDKPSDFESLSCVEGSAVTLACALVVRVTVGTIEIEGSDTLGSVGDGALDH